MSVRKNLLCLLLLAFSFACASETKEITTQEEVNTIRRVMIEAAVGIEAEVVSYVKDSDQETTKLSGEKACPGGEGTVRLEATHIVTRATAEFTETYSYSDCLVSDVRLNGSVTTVTESLNNQWTGSRTGTLETSLGSCAFDVTLEGEGETAALSESGTVCGIELKAPEG